ncbi:hypothetical protein VTN77DRAFT_2820 [Rasamsonia byssochlamydoides]|uniref:uncharacterized protein n=1 Tax=Rasamsonia byssochlamydoides TaxID=89139 RepID=UPI0037438DB2
MSFLAFRLLKIGVNQAKIRKARKNQAQQDAHSGWYDNGSGEMQLISPQLTGGGARSPAKAFADTFLRFFQFVLGLTVVGLYGVDLNHARQKHVYADAKWVYAEVTAGLGALTALIYLTAPFMLKDPLAVRHRLHLPFFLWECTLCILWLTLFGIFGKMYISEDPEGEPGIVRMKHAVWVDLTNLGLWTITATWCGIRWRRGMKAAAAGRQEEKFVEQTG